MRARTRLFALLSIGVGAGMACTAGPGESGNVDANANANANANARTVLAANVHPLARAGNDVGRVDGATVFSNVSLVVKPSAQQRADRDALLAAQIDPASPQYHRWLTASSYAARFGASADEIARMSAWLTSQGLAVQGASRTGTQVRFGGSVAAIERAFGTELHRYDIRGEHHFAMASAPSIPSEFADRVAGIHGLHDWKMRAPKRAARPEYLDDAGVAPRLLLAPADFAALYDVAPLYAANIDGAGQTIAVVGQTYVDPNDLQTFRATFGLPAMTPTFVLVPGSGAQAVTTDQDEANLDLDWAGGVARGASLVYVYTGDAPNSNGVVDALAYAIDNEVAPIVSMSYVGCDALEAADANLDGELAAAANLLGMTIVSAAGNDGAAGCVAFGIGGRYVGPPASFPGVVAVGGSAFTTTTQTLPYWNDAGAALEYIPESAWNESEPGAGAAGLAATGGGASTIFQKPFWQVGVSPNDQARDVPDVTLHASNADAPCAVQSRGSLSGMGGTSCTTPAFAGILALVNQAVASAGGAAKLGNANPMLYALNASTPSAFHDITTGDNVAGCTRTDPSCPDGGTYGGYSASVGYDLATGLGSIDANALVTAWAALAPTTTTLQTSALSAAEGAPLLLTANVASASTTREMTGRVSFTFVTYGADGGTDDSWVLGSVNVIAGADGGDETATATLSAAIPPGAQGQADVVAMYEGDAHYLASRSGKTRVSVTGVSFFALPSAPTLQPNAFQQFTTTGGTAPVVWQVVRDGTCNAFSQCAHLSANGLYQAGPVDGETIVQAIDANGADVFVTVTVAGAPIDAGVDASGESDAGADAAADAGPGADAGEQGGEDGGPADASLADAPPPEGDSGPADVIDGGSGGSGSDSGCGCVVAGASGAHDERPLSGVLLGLAGALAVRARRRARSGDRQ